MPRSNLKSLSESRRGGGKKKKKQDDARKKKPGLKDSVAERPHHSNFSDQNSVEFFVRALYHNFLKSRRCKDLQGLYNSLYFEKF